MAAEAVVAEVEGVPHEGDGFLRGINEGDFVAVGGFGALFLADDGGISVAVGWGGFGVVASAWVVDLSGGGDGEGDEDR